MLVSLSFFPFIHAQTFPMIFFRRISRKKLYDQDNYDSNSNSDSSYYRRKPLPPITSSTSCYYEFTNNNHTSFISLLPRPQDIFISSFDIPHLLMPTQQDNSVLGSLAEKTEYADSFSKQNHNEEDARSVVTCNDDFKKRDELFAVHKVQKVHNANSFVSEKTMVDTEGNDNTANKVLAFDDSTKKDLGLNDSRTPSMGNTSIKQETALLPRVIKRKKRVDLRQIPTTPSLIPRKASSVEHRITNVTTIPLEPSVSTPLTRRLRHNSGSKIPVSASMMNNTIASEKTLVVIPIKSNSTSYTSSQIPKRKNLWY
ncbi:MAG: hypothetical protein EXX96DRAFT_605934 [Benjaminiella poitrasii]|nr:MAG: hypothetical protein EXX96DRAFT_605934 [Benjaminiella poitrasii]